MNTEKAKEIIKMFPAEKPLCFNYQNARNIVLELLQELQGNRILNILTDYFDGIAVSTQVEMFRVRDDIENPESAFTTAIEDLCASKEGANLLNDSHGNQELINAQRNARDNFLRGRGFSHFGEPTNFFVPTVELEDVDHDDEESLLFYRLRKLFEI